MKSAKKLIALVLSLVLMFSCVAIGMSASAETPEQNSEEVDTSFIPSSINCNRKFMDPVYVKINGQSYNLLSPIGAIGAMIAAKTEQQKKTVAFTYMELVIHDVLNLLAGSAAVANTTIKDISEFDSKGFMPGTATFADSATSDKWRLGYSQKSLLPDDILTGKKDYYLAGYLLQNLPSNTVETVLDDMKVYTVVMDAGAGAVAFSTIECIGISNADIRQIREMLTDFAKANNIISINVTATHCHSEIDTMGLWNPFFSKIANNTLAAMTNQLIFKTQGGPDEEFMSVLRERTAESIKEACNNMEKGDLYYAEKNGDEYFFDKRDPSEYDGNVYRLRFDPDNSESKETMIVNIPAHPYITGLKTDNSSGKELSGDYTAAMDRTMTENGYNFMFIIGATLGIYPDRAQTNDELPHERRSQHAERYGEEMAMFVMSMTKTKQEILDNYYKTKYFSLEQIQQGVEQTKDQERKYTVWYENWEKVEEERVEPILNIRTKEVFVTVENPIILLVGKLGLVNHTLLDNGDGSYSTVTEVGYVEFGKNIKAIMMPGEVSPEIIYGGGTISAENSFSGCDFPAKTADETLALPEDQHLLCFGLANDEIGYILNDNDYCLLFFDNVEPFGDHYQESIAFARSSGSILMNAFEKLVDEVR